MQDSLEDYIRISRNTKEEPIQIKKEVLLTAHIKKECDTKALQIVQLAIDGKLRPETLFRCLPFITRDHFQDIVEERSVTKLCGYPLCGKKIPDMPKKQFLISSKSNKVYDITERKNFCTNYCYKASIHIRNQIDDSPLWLRKYEQCPRYTLLPKSDKGVPGVLIEQGIRKSIVEHFTSVSDFTQLSLDEAEEIELRPQEENVPKVPQKRPKKYQKKYLRTISESGEVEEIDQAEKLEDNVPKAQALEANQEVKEPKTRTENINSDSAKSQLELEQQLSKVFNEWISLDTLILIHGETKIREKINSQWIDDYLQQLEKNELRAEQQKKYRNICKKLQLDELLEEKMDNYYVQRKCAQIPDYKQLKTDLKAGNEQVKAFYSGELHVRNDPNFPSAQNNEEEQVESGPPSLLPLSSVNSQQALRRQIFSNSLNKTLNCILQNLKMTPNSILPEVQKLIKTFNLKADNITFKPHVWTYISVLLLQILTMKNEDLKLSLQTEHSKEYFSILLPNDTIISNMLGNLANIDDCLHKYLRCDIMTE